MTPFFSIIIPVYNISEYLPQCLESIQNQDFSDYEVLLIDDGSTDGSDAVCKSFAEKDSHFLYFRKENGGVGSARNLGLMKASGKWIWFVDGDDWVSKDSFSTIFNNLQECNLIDIGYTENKVDEETTYCGEDSLLAVDEYAAKHFCFTVWKQLYKKSIIEKNNLTFSEYIKYFEDQEFIVKYQTCCEGNVCCVSNSLYHYRIREGSAMQKSNGIKVAEDGIKVAESLFGFFIAEKIKYKKWHSSRIERLVKNVLFTLKKTRLLPEEKILYKRKISAIMDKYKNLSPDYFSGFEFTLVRKSLSIYFFMLDLYMFIKR